MKRIVILISGRGSNMAAIIDAAAAGKIDGRVVAVISNRPNTNGLAIADNHGITTRVVDHRAFPDRTAFEQALADAIDAPQPDLVVLAGFMRVLSAPFVGRYAGRLLNIHPSLLPSYRGLDTHRRALEDGVKVHGCTVHFVTSDVDHGPIVAQGAVAVEDRDDEATLAARVLAVEHRILPAAVEWFCADRLVVDGNRVRVMCETRDPGKLIVPAVAVS